MDIIVHYGDSTFRVSGSMPAAKGVELLERKLIKLVPWERYRLRNYGKCKCDVEGGQNHFMLWAAVLCARTAAGSLKCPVQEQDRTRCRSTYWQPVSCYNFIWHCCTFQASTGNRFQIQNTATAARPAEADIELNDCELMDMEVEESTNSMV